MATELNFNDNFFASIIPDMPADGNTVAAAAVSTDDFLKNLFGGGADVAPAAPTVTPVEAPAPAPAAEVPAEQPKVEETKAEETPAPAEEVKAEAEPAPAPAEEMPAPAVQEEVKAEAEAPTVPEVKAEEAPAPKAEEKPAEQPKAEAAPEVKAEPAKAEVKAEAPAAEAKSEEVSVEVSKPKRAKRTKRSAAKKETTKLDVPEAGQLDENFIPSLLLSVGPRYEESKQKIQELMNEIELTPDMNKATVQTMIAKQTKLAKMIEFYGEGYHDALENLAGKDGMIERIILRTAQETEGTATEKKDAGRVACMNYVDPKTGEHQDLMQWKKGLESAVGFFSRAADYCKTTGVALSTYSKLY